jgi:hypothetical protein
MFHSLHEFWRYNFVGDVPIEMDLCLDCGVLNCLEDRFKECAPRKARAAELAAERAAASAPGPSEIDALTLPACVGGRIPEKVFYLSVVD